MSISDDDSCGTTTSSMQPTHPRIACHAMQMHSVPWGVYVYYLLTRRDVEVPRDVCKDTVRKSFTPHYQNRTEHKSSHRTEHDRTEQDKTRRDEPGKIP